MIRANHPQMLRAINPDHGLRPSTAALGATGPETAGTWPPPRGNPAATPGILRLALPRGWRYFAGGVSVVPMM
jgi:hypothetical protein